MSDVGWETLNEFVSLSMYQCADVRVLIIQPSVPEYRCPFFEQLSHVHGLCLRVVASEDGLTAGELKGGERSTTFEYSTCANRAFFSGRLFWQQGLRLGNWLRKGDVLVVSGNPRYLSNFPLILQAKKRGVGVVWWGHGWSSGSRGFTAWLRRKIMQLADVVLLYTDAEVASYVSLGFDPARTFATNNALDQTLAQQYSMNWEAKRLTKFQEDNLVSGRRVLLFCGRLLPKADLTFLLRALPQVVARWPNVLLVVIGDGPELSRLQSLAKELGVERYVRWFGSIYNEAELAPWFLLADAFVFPGAIGLSVLHSMGYGLPVLTHSDSTRHGPEFAAIDAGKNSLTYTRGDLGDFLKQLSQLLADETFRESLSRAARDTVTTTYSMSGMVQRFIGAVEAASRFSSRHGPSPSA